MKTLLALSLFALVGCSSLPKKNSVQALLDRELPASYTGDAKVEHHNVWIDVTIDAKGLRREPDGWHWKSLTYRRSGRASTGSITLGSP